MLLPLRRPTIGISIGGHALGLARRTGRHGVGEFAERPLPAGLVRISPAQPNVADADGLAAELRGLLNGSRRRSAVSVVALSLPDFCARSGLFDFESWPGRAAEREALIRWRFQKDFNAPVGDARVAYRVFARPSSDTAREKGEQAAVRVLATAVRRDILGQYEEVCAQAGLLPAAVGLAGLQVYELCRPVMAAAMPESGGQFGFLHLTEESFVFLAVRDGRPLYLRVKPLRPAIHQQPIALWQEVVATLQFYEERFPWQGASPSRASFPLFYVGAPADWSEAGGAGPTMPGVVVRRIGWGELGPLCGRDDLQAAAGPGQAVVPALSAVLGES